MSQFEASVVLPQPRGVVFDYLCRPANMFKLMAADAGKNVSLKLPEIMEVGGRLEFEVKTMGTHFQVVQQVMELTQHDRITLHQIQGPFKSWIHQCHLSDTDVGDTLLKTVIQFEPPGGLLGFVATRSAINSFLNQWVNQGHEAFRRDLAGTKS